MLLAATTAGVPAIICTLLLIATIIAFILGFAEALGLTRYTGSKFGTLVLAVVLLVVLIVLC